MNVGHSTCKQIVALLNNDGFRCAMLAAWQNMFFFFFISWLLLGKVAWMHWNVGASHNISKRLRCVPKRGTWERRKRNWMRRDRDKLFFSSFISCVCGANALVGGRSMLHLIFFYFYIVETTESFNCNDIDATTIFQLHFETLWSVICTRPASSYLCVFRNHFVLHLLLRPTFTHERWASSALFWFCPMTVLYGYCMLHTYSQ